MGLLDADGPAEAQAAFSWEALWSLFDGDEERLNIAHECLDRHDPERTAARIAYADGDAEELTFGELSRIDRSVRACRSSGSASKPATASG